MARLTDEIATPRLILRLLQRPALDACMAGDAAQATRLLGANVPDALLGPTSSLRYTLAELDRDPAYGPWGTRAIVLRATGEMAGYIRFHERPSPARPHPFGGLAAEFGYSVFPAHQRRGYATEAVGAMMRWAEDQHGITRFIAAISPANTASRALAARLGFVRIGRQIDEIDGPEDVFLRAAP